MTTRIKSSEPEAVIDPSGGASGNALLPSNSKKNVVANVYRQTRKVPRTTNNNPTKSSFKSPEDMYDEIMELKKSMAALAEENSTLKARLRRVEDDNAKKNEELRRTIADKKSSASAVVNSMRQKVFKLEQALKEKESAMKKLQSDMKVTRANEMKVQMETYYQEILRLKNATNLRKTSRTDNNVNEEQNSNNNNEAISKEKAIIEQLTATNKTLQEEIAALQNDLSRALSIDRVGEHKGDYVNLNKDELLTVVTQLEEKLQSAMSHNAADETKPLAEVRQDEKAKTEAMMLKLREDRLYYHELAQSREQEIKVLKLLIETWKKERTQSSSSSASSKRTTPSSSHMVRRLTQDNSGSDTDTLSKASARKSVATKSAPARSAQPKTSAFRRSTTSSQSAKISGSDSETSKQSSITKRSLRSPQSNASETDSPRSFTKPKSLHSEKSSSSEMNQSASKLLTKGNKSNVIPTNKVSKDSKPRSNLKSSPKTREKRTQPIQKAELKTSSDEASSSLGNMDTIEVPNHDSSVLESGGPSTVVVKSAVTRTMITHTPPQEAASKKNNSEPGSPSSKKSSAFKSLPYTMVQAPNTSDAGRVQTAAGDPSENQRYDRVQTFRQNHAAKKIQKQWKQHQKEVTEVQVRQVRLQKLEVIQHNHAARTIQRGWKKHTTEKLS